MTELVASLLQDLAPGEIVALCRWRFGADVASLVRRLPAGSRAEETAALLASRGLLDDGLLRALVERLPARADEVGTVELPSLPPPPTPLRAMFEQRGPRGGGTEGAKAGPPPEPPPPPVERTVGRAPALLSPAQVDALAQAVNAAGLGDDASLRAIGAGLELELPALPGLEPADRVLVHLLCLNAWSDAPTLPLRTWVEAAITRGAHAEELLGVLERLENARAALVELTTGDATSGTFANGVLVSPELVLTCSFIEDKNFFAGGMVATVPGRRERRHVRVGERVVPSESYALLRLDAPIEGPVASLAWSAPDAGSGRSSPFRLLYRDGSAARVQEGLALVESTSAAVRYLVDAGPGASGGPLVDGQGRVFAVHTGGGDDRLRFGAPVSAIRRHLAASRPEVLDELEPRGAAATPLLTDGALSQFYRACGTSGVWGRMETLAPEHRRFFPDATEASTMTAARSGDAGREALVSLADEAIRGYPGPRNDEDYAVLVGTLRELRPDDLSLRQKRMPVARLESTIGVENFLPVGFLALGERAARSVARVRVPRIEGGAPVLRGGVPEGADGTGFLVAPRLLLTNHHVVACRLPSEPAPTPEDLSRQAVGAKVRLPGDDGPRTMKVLALAHADATLDYAVLELETDGPAARLSRRPVDLRARPRQWVNIVQHPDGKDSVVVVRDNLLYVARHEAPSPELAYIADTRPGSSGSPVFDDNWEVLGLHRAGDGPPRTDPVSGQPARVNVGVPIVAILADLGVHAPDLHARILASQEPA